MRSFTARLGQSVAPYSRHVKLRLVNFTGKSLPKIGCIEPFLRLFCASVKGGESISNR